jgi:hypothetical protein
MITDLLFLLAPPQDVTGKVAVEAAYVLHTYQDEAVQECCGRCKNGVITHGDGHTSPCPCPPDCKCKAKSEVIHPPSVLRQTCPDGRCTPKK